MPQNLLIETTSADGTKSQKKVKVIRSWQDASGHAVYLFGNGSYGYKNGEPVRDESEFSIITTPIQNKAARNWWARAGKELSAHYYEAKARNEARLMGDFMESPAAGDSKFDEVLYFRKRADGQGDIEGPFAWPDLFAKRPDWWGQAKGIAFADYEYRQESELADEARPVDPRMGPPAMQAGQEGAPGLQDASVPKGSESGDAIGKVKSSKKK